VTCVLNPTVIASSSIPRDPSISGACTVKAILYFMGTPPASNRRQREASASRFRGSPAAGPREQRRKRLENIRDAIGEYLAAREDLLSGTVVREVEVAG
jgi:hypothetical protein